MTLFAATFSTIMTALVAALLYAMPSIVRPTVPLGVSVPQSHVDDAVITTAVRRFRTGVLVSFVVSVAVAVALSGPSPAAAIIVPVLLVPALGFTAYVMARRTIIRAKNDGRWYEDVPVRLAADVTAPRASARPAVPWFVASLMTLVIASGIGIGIYPGLPDPLPIHWNFEGVADGFADKSIWSAFGVIMTGFGIVLLLFAISFLTRMAPARRTASDSPDVAEHRAAVQQRLMNSLLGQITFATTLEIGVIAVISWLAPTTAWFTVAPTLLFLVLIAAIIASYFVRYRRLMADHPRAAVHTRTPAGSSSPAPAAPRPDAPDDDRFWKGGLVYVNRRDPALMVPKRFGIGWTINLGHPAGIALGVVLLLLIAGGITWSILAS